MFVCKFCGKDFNKKSYLKNHINKYHFREMNYPFKCEICCNKGFDDIKGLNVHLNTVHKNIDIEDYWNKYIFGKLKCKY